MVCGNSVSFSVSAISRMLSKIDEDKARVSKDRATIVIIVPLFTTQSWLLRLLITLIENPLTLTKTSTSLYCSHRRKKISTMPKVVLYNKRFIRRSYLYSHAVQEDRNTDSLRDLHNQVGLILF